MERQLNLEEQRLLEEELAARAAAAARRRAWLQRIFWVSITAGVASSVLRLQHRQPAVEIVLRYGWLLGAMLYIGVRSVPSSAWRRGSSVGPLEAKGEDAPSLSIWSREFQLVFLILGPPLVQLAGMIGQAVLK